MKPLQFKIPKSGADRIHWQEDIGDYFYPHLHMHPEIQFTYIVKGKGTFVCGSYLGPFSEGDIYVIGPSVPHIFRSEKNEGGAHALTLFAEAPFILRTLFSQGDVQTGESFVSDSGGGILITDCHFEIYKLIEQFRYEEGIDRLIIFSKLIKLLSYKKPYKVLMNIIPGKWNENDSERLENVYSWMMNEYHERLTLDEAADRCALSKSAFCRYFRQHTGKSFVELLTEIRLQSAARMLKETSDSVQNICYLSGFNNLSLFNRKFLEYQGMSPSVFRKSHQMVKNG